MNVDINQRGVDRKINEVSRNTISVDQAWIGFHHCFVKKRMLHKTVVDKEELFAVCFFGLLRATDKSLDMNQSCFAVDIDQARIDGFAENINDTLA